MVKVRSLLMAGLMVGVGLVSPGQVRAAFADIALPASSVNDRFHILYRAVDADDWQYSVRDIPGTTRTYRVEGLNSKVKYEYSVVSVGKKGTVGVANPRVMKVYTAEQKRAELKGKNFSPIGSTKGRAEWAFRAGAVSYNAYYKERGEEKWKYSVGGLSNTTNRLVIRSLNPKEGYEYLVMAVDNKGRESRVVQKILKAR